MLSFCRVVKTNTAVRDSLIESAYRYTTFEFKILAAYGIILQNIHGSIWCSIMTLSRCMRNLWLVVNIVSVSVPCKVVTLGPKEPDFVTPSVKMLWKQCYRLHRCACYADGNVVAQKINAMISVNRSSAISDIEQLDCCKLFGVFFQSNFKMDFRVQYLLSQCAQRVYLLKPIFHQGMPREQLAVVTKAISRILYALPAWEGPCLLNLLVKSMLFSNVLIVFVICSHIDLSDLLHNSDHDLFYKVCTPVTAYTIVYPLFAPWSLT